MAAVAGRYARAFAEVVAEHKLDAAKTVEELTALTAICAMCWRTRPSIRNKSLACWTPS